MATDPGAQLVVQMCGVEPMRVLYYGCSGAVLIFVNEIIIIIAQQQ